MAELNASESSQLDPKWEAIWRRASLHGPSYALYRGDASTVVASLPERSINTCLTSPPYWGARDYGHHEQMGLEFEVDEYVSRLVQAFRMIRRVLTDDGTAWLNVGDVYYHGCGTIDGKPPLTGWKRNKQLSLVPFRLAIALEDDGWWVRNVTVWHKTNAMPSSVRDRLTNVWEPFFLLAKSERYYFNLDGIRVPHRTSDAVEIARASAGANNGKAKGKIELRRWLNSPRHRLTIEGKREIRRRPNAPEPTELAAYLRTAMERKGLTIHDVARSLGQPFERTRHYFRVDALGSRLPPEETWEELKELLDLGTEFDDAMAVEVGDNVFRNHPKGRNPGDVVPVAVSSHAHAHFATMPLALAEWALKATLPAGGVCIDPFMGHGTTGLAANNLGGRFVGIDVHPEFLESFPRMKLANHLRKRKPMRADSDPVLFSA